jgi:hypothetical protein
MDLPILKYVDVVIGFALVMILASTVVLTVTQLGATLARSRGKYLSWVLRELFIHIDETNLPRDIARALSNAVLRHTLIGKSNWMRKFLPILWPLWSWLPDRLRGSVIKREELIRILLEIASGTTTLAVPLQRAFGFSGGAADAANALRAIGEQMLKLEQSDPNEAEHVRATKAIIAGTWANALVAKIDAWWDQSRDRVTQRYAFEAKAATIIVALVVVGWAQLDSFDLLRRLSADDKFRAALVQQAEAKQKELDKAQAGQSAVASGGTAPAADTQAAPPAPPASPQQARAEQDDIALLKKQKEQLEAAVADLNQPNLGITSQYYRATTKAVASLPSNQSQYTLTVGTKTYPLTIDTKTDPLQRDPNEDFTTLARQINALDPALHAHAFYKQQANKILYYLTIASRTPDLKTLELRPEQGDNMVERVEPYYPWWNLLPHWPGIILSWILVSLGAPFWYDVMKNLLRLRPSLAKQEEQDRQERQRTR